MLRALKNRRRQPGAEQCQAPYANSKAETGEDRGPDVGAGLAGMSKVSPKRRLLFIFTAALLPWLFLCLLEGVLRCAGYGYDPAFFKRVHGAGGNYVVENFRFGWRFFPPQIARSPVPSRFLAHKSAGTIRIFLFGESAAMGDPEPDYGFGRQLQRILQDRHPEGPVEVINVAMTAINSHVIREIARDCSQLEGDVWIVYAGNNEVVGPYGAGTVFGPAAPKLGIVQALLAAKRFRVGQLLANVGKSPEQSKEWQGMEFFLEKQVRAADPRLEQVYRNFDGNLSAIVETGQTAGAKVILGTVAVNLCDCPPFKSVHRAGLGQPELNRWEDLVTKGGEEEAKGADGAALGFYLEASKIDPEYAELVFRQARCELRLGQSEGSRTNFDRARDLDSLRFRADSKINGLIRKTAAAHGIELVDCARETESIGSNSVPGDELFYDHVHFNFHGNYLIATSLTAKVERMLFEGREPSKPILSEREVAHQLAFTDFDRLRVGQEMRLRLQQPPFSSQSNFKERDAHWGKMLTQTKPDPNGAISEYRVAVSLYPEDWVLRSNFGRLLESAGDKAGAKEQWTHFVTQMDQEPDGYYELGNLAYDAGAYQEASEWFRQTLNRRPGSSEALNALGLAMAAQHETNEAQRQYEAALKSNPRFSAARINLASLLASNGEIRKAAEQYEVVLRSDTNNTAATINLAKLFFGQGKTNEAIVLYTRALNTRPDNAIAHFDLGNALTSVGRHTEALAQYAAAVQYQPNFADAQYNLALELARTGRLAEAIPHLETVIRLNPKFTEGHFNYAVALAKFQRYPEAAREFEETLKLDPNHGSARALLEKAVQLSSRVPKQQ